MPYCDLDKKREYQREWVRQKRIAQKQGSTTLHVVKGSTGFDRVRQHATSKAPKAPHVGSNAIYHTPTIITTHRFEIRAGILTSPTCLPNVKQLAKGGGRRIKYSVVDLDNCFIEYYKKAAILVLKAGHEIANADPERVEALKHVLANASNARGVKLALEDTWAHGLFSHTVMEDDGLNAFFKPLAVAEWGDQDLHFFEDQSHTGKVEMGGKRSFDAAENLRFMLLEFPKAFSAYNENIVKHLAVLDEMSITLKAIREELNKR